MPRRDVRHGSAPTKRLDRRGQRRWARRRDRIRANEQRHRRPRRHAFRGRRVRGRRALLDDLVAAAHELPPGLAAAREATAGSGRPGEVFYAVFRNKRPARRRRVLKAPRGSDLRTGRRRPRRRVRAVGPAGELARGTRAAVRARRRRRRRARALRRDDARLRARLRGGRHGERDGRPSADRHTPTARPLSVRRRLRRPARRRGARLLRAARRARRALGDGAAWRAGGRGVGVAPLSGFQ